MVTINGKRGAGIPRLPLCPALVALVLGGTIANAAEPTDEVQPEQVLVTEGRYAESATGALEPILDIPRNDRPTAGLIEVLARTPTSMQLLLIGTYRPAGVAGGEHPLQALLPDLLVHRLCSQLPLDPSRASGLEREDQPEVALMQ